MADEGLDRMLAVLSKPAGQPAGDWQMERELHEFVARWTWRHFRCFPTRNGCTGARNAWASRPPRMAVDRFRPERPFLSAQAKGAKGLGSWVRIGTRIPGPERAISRSSPITKSAYAQVSRQGLSPCGVLDQESPASSHGWVAPFGLRGRFCHAGPGPDAGMALSGPAILAPIPFLTQAFGLG
jgi:hypothetical protein